MKFKEAEQKMKEIAGGEYHSLYYKVHNTSKTNKEVECSVYVHGGDIHTGNTWEAAISKLESEIAGTEHPESEGAPE